MTKNVIEVQVHTLGGTDVTFSDSTDAGSGSAAYAALSGKRDIVAPVTADETTSLFFIPYHSVDSAAVTITPTEVEDPEDATCPKEGD